MTDRPARRRRAKKLMDGLTVACVTAAIAVGTGQLVKEGLQEFLYRPPGVGASPSEQDSVAQASPSPQAAQFIPPAPSPSPPVPRSNHHAGHRR